MKTIENMKIKIFSDGAKLEDFQAMERLSFIKGYTTNPTLMKKAGITNYNDFAKQVLDIVTNKPISFEVIADEFDEMMRQAIKLSNYGKNVYVKIPIMNTKGESSVPLIKNLISKNIKVNVTAIMTTEQIKSLTDVFKKDTSTIVSVFAGRIADTGRDPISIMKKATEILMDFENVQLLWASTRELINIFQAENANCDIITVPPAIIKKFKNINRNLFSFSHETVKMFYEDAISSGFSL